MPVAITPTVEDLEKKIAKLQRQNDDLVERNQDLEYQQELRLGQEHEAQEADERRTERARQALINHHDDAGHRGSQRFCTEAPCPAFNALLDDGDL